MTTRAGRFSLAALLPAMLSLIAGAVDVICFLALGGLFTAHITGNFVILAAHYATGGFSQVGPLLSIPIFLAVLYVVSLAAEAIKNNGLSARRPLLTLQAALLTACLALSLKFSPFPNADSPTAVFVGMLAVAAMATQNVLSTLGLPGVPSTAVMTTNIVHFMVDLATLTRKRNAQDTIARAKHRSSITFQCVIGFLVGCIAGAILEMRFSLNALAFPVALAILAIPLGQSYSRDESKPSPQNFGAR